MARLVLGPLLRYVGPTEATVWVETDEPCEIEVRGHQAATFEVEGHHYGLVVVEHLEPGSAYDYGVTLDTERAWPPPSGDWPPSAIRTLPSAGGTLRIAFGSCRNRSPRACGPDALEALACRLGSRPGGQWPHILLLLGDQVYADQPPASVPAGVRPRRGGGRTRREMADFEEYTALYQEAWRPAAVRWLLSSVPSAMVFDDHEVRDTWNTDEGWLRHMQAKPWWRERMVGGIMAYWLYQHIGNLSPAELAADEVLAELRAGDGGAALRRLATEVEAGSGHGVRRWSYRRDLGRSRLLVVDVRCGRVLGGASRDVLAPGGWRWLERHATGDVDHLLVASSVPVLLPPAVHHLEAWSEAVGAGAWGRAARMVGDGARRAVPLEHWAAFRRSFERLAVLLRAIAAGRRGAPPASVILISGDVHYSYVARAELAGACSAVTQVVSSPLRNRLSPSQRLVHRFSTTPLCEVVVRALAATAGAHRRALRWHLSGGPWFDDAVATLELDGRRADVVVERAAADEGGSRLEVVARANLAHEP